MQIHVQLAASYMYTYKYLCKAIAIIRAHGEREREREREREKKKDKENVYVCMLLQARVQHEGCTGNMMRKMALSHEESGKGIRRSAKHGQALGINPCDETGRPRASILATVMM